MTRHVFYSPPGASRGTEWENYNSLYPWDNVNTSSFVESYLSQNPVERTCVMVDHIPESAEEEPFIPEFEILWDPEENGEWTPFTGYIEVSYEEPFDPTVENTLTVYDTLGCTAVSQPLEEGETKIRVHLIPEEYYSPNPEEPYPFPFMVKPAFGWHDWEREPYFFYYDNPNYITYETIHPMPTNQLYNGRPLPTDPTMVGPSSNPILTTTGAKNQGLIDRQFATRPFTYSVGAQDGYEMDMETGEISKPPAQGYAFSCREASYPSVASKIPIVDGYVTEYTRSVYGENIKITLPNQIYNPFTDASEGDYSFWAKKENNQLICQTNGSLFNGATYFYGTWAPSLANFSRGDNLVSYAGTEGVRSTILSIYNALDDGEWCYIYVRVHAYPSNTYNQSQIIFSGGYRWA